MRVTYFQRRPQGGAFSIERLFADVRGALPAGIEATVAVSRFPSRGVGRRIYNIFEAVFRQGDVNHVTGDVHFLTYLLRGKRTLLTICDLTLVHRLDGWRRLAILLLWYWLPVRRAAVISVISDFTKEDLLKHIKVDPGKIRVIAVPVGNGFQPVPAEFNGLKPTVLQVGTTDNKNLERVAQALQGVPCHLRVIGNLDEYQVGVLERCGLEYSSVTGISDAAVTREYRRCDLVVFASTFEGFGMPIIEAQATGRPVVTSTVCSMPDVAGGAACLVDPFDVRSIRNGILKVIENPAYRESLIHAGLANVDRFRPEQIAREYVTIYRELLREGP